MNPSRLFPPPLASRLAVVLLTLLAEPRPAAAQEKIVFIEAELDRDSPTDPESDTFEGAFVSSVFYKSLPLNGEAFITSGGAPGLLIGEIKASVSETAGEDENWSARLLVGLRTQRFGSEPPQAGVAGVLEFSYSLSDGSRDGGTADLTLSATGMASVNDPGREEPLEDTRSIPILFGQFPHHELTLALRSRATREDARSEASGSVQFSLTIFEMRNHWEGGSSGSLVDASRWADKNVPTAAQYAAFSRATPVNAFVTLGGGSSVMRGLIVDGSSVTADLGGGSLRFGVSGPSQKDYNILLGEGRSRASTLALRNGVVHVERGLVVGGQPGASARLELGPAMAVGSGAAPTTFLAVVGQAGDGVATIGAGSSLEADALAIGDAANVSGSVEVAGVGARLSAIGFLVGNRGRGEVRVRDGGEAVANALTMSAQRGARADMFIGPSGTLRLSGPISVVGQEDSATLEVFGGSKILGGSGIVEVGADDVTTFSALRLSDLGTRMTAQGVRVRAGGLLHIRDGAEWIPEGLAENALELKAGEALFESAVCVVDTVVATGGRINVNSNASLTATTILIEPGARMNVNGTLATVKGFDLFALNGVLNVSNGGALFGLAPEDNEGFRGELGVGENGSIEGSEGAIHANVRMAAGSLLEPGNSPGALTIDGDLILEAGSRLRLEVAGAEAGSLFDQLVVTGDVVFEGGVIELVFVDGFAPEAGQNFEFLEAASIVGAADVEVSGLQPGWQFEPQFAAEEGSFAVASLGAGVAIVSASGETELRIVDYRAVESPPSWLVLSGKVVGGPAGGEVDLQASAGLANPWGWQTVETLPLDAAGEAEFSLSAPSDGAAVFLRIAE